MARKKGRVGGKAKREEPQNDGPLSKKQKRMLKKKEKHAQQDGSSDEDIPPMPETTGGMWDFTGQPQVVSEGAKKKKKSEAGLKTCPAGHPMRVFGTPHDEYLCDAAVSCDGGFLAQGSLLFGCRLCDWDACEKCTAGSVRERTQGSLKEEERKARAKAEAIGAEITKADRVGAWRFLRGTDKYQNEYLVLRHEKTGACAEMHSYSDLAEDEIVIVHDPRSGQFTFQNGTGCMVRCVSTDGQIVPFQFTQIGLLSKLANGGSKQGKEVPEKGIDFGNYNVVSLEDGGALASMNFKFTKTTKHKDDPFKAPYTGKGLETHFTSTGDIIYLPAESIGDKGVIMEAWKEPRTTSRKEASDMLIDEEDRLE